MVIPIPMGKTTTSEFTEYDNLDAPWEEDTPIAPDTPASYGEIADLDTATDLSTVALNSGVIDSAGSTYRLRQGDTLWSLAVRFYGDGKRYHDILAANSTTIPNMNAMPIGATIVLPR